MKKIYLLFVILITFISISAQKVDTIIDKGIYQSYLLLFKI